MKKTKRKTFRAGPVCMSVHLWEATLTLAQLDHGCEMTIIFVLSALGFLFISQAILKPVQEPLGSFLFSLHHLNLGLQLH